AVARAMSCCQPLPSLRSAMARTASGPRASARGRASSTTKSLPSPFILRKGIAGVCISNLIALLPLYRAGGSCTSRDAARPSFEEQEGDERHRSKGGAGKEGGRRADPVPYQAGENAGEQGGKPGDQPEQPKRRAAQAVRRGRRDQRR